jgi:hypothetical protein
MVYNIQNYWVSGLCPSSGILDLGKATFQKLEGNKSNLQNVVFSIIYNSRH